MAALDHSGPGEFGLQLASDSTCMAGRTWMPGTYDPELTFSIGQRATVHQTLWEIRGPATTFTLPASWLLTLTVGTEVYFQFTPHDLYDYDATETPV